ncbi:DNA primase [Flavobacterium sediminilitoris]|uniref:DNA primase n=1 Tax=Flavobacterium sediminilitoris TaxID=2024526 RepID=A0ABY4HSY2_9FLAO|nr:MULTISPECIES: DNA primase [Flavobacterium]UOX35287.1 DNA primase [Flavobacterium sediminilitoris]
MKFIKQSSIDTVLDEALVYDVVSATEILKKQGANFFCLSPFTSENTPSFAVNPVKNYFYDNSAGFGGNAITFLMKKYPSISFFEAIEKAAEICGITLEYEERSADQKRLDDEDQAMKKFVEFANKEYQKAFKNLADDSWAKTMIFKERNYTSEIVEAFMIGFAPEEPKSYISTPAINQGMFELSKTLGFTNTSNNISYDFFRNRIMFPIHNDKGIVVGFGGRKSNDESNKKYAKYLNSKESKIYFKDKLLYGLYQAKKSIIVAEKAVLMEGYTDVIASHQAGLTISVATCGTALSEFHAKLLSRFSKHIILFRDGDKAGLRAVHRDIDILLKFGIKVEVVICPEGEDPDSLSKQCNLVDFVEKNRQDAITWKAKFLKEDSKNPEIPNLIKELEFLQNKEIGEIYEKIVPDTNEAYKNANAVEKRMIKKDNDLLFKQISEIERDYKAQIEELPKFEPELVAQSVESMATTLSLIPNEIVLQHYIKLVSKILDQKPQIITGVIQSKKEEAQKKKSDQEKETDAKESKLLKLPEGAKKDQFLEDRFCEIGETYYFMGKSGEFFIGTNFTVIPLFHIDGNQENKRLCEVKNVNGAKRLIDFDSTDIINFTKFKERLIKEGNFFWEPGATNENFLLVSRKLVNEFITASEIKTLGHQQKEGFFAFADGIFHNDQFLKVNKYGIVHVEGLEKSSSEYKADVCHYYSPAYSEIYKSAREDDDPYENDRHFIYKIAPISLDQWMMQLVKVFGDKGKLGLAFCIAANFRDLFLANWKYFPLMGGFGQRDSGKSGFGNCLQSFFYFNIPPLELNTSTLVGISRRLSRVKNTVVFFDEYRDDIDEDKHQQLKGGWNGIGREKGKGAETNRTSSDKINSAIYYAGQYLPTKDDGALPSRSIILNFEQKERSIEEKEEYNKLMNWNKTGISSFVLDVLKYRKYVADNIIKTYSEVLKDLKNSLKEEENIQNRILENYLAILVIMKLLQDKFTFPFTYQEYFDLTRRSIIDNSDTISDSDGLAAFWRVIEYLSTPGHQRQIKEGEDYIIITDSIVNYVPKKGEKAQWKNENKDKVLYLAFSKVHQDYHKEVTKRQGEEVIHETTIRNYLKSKKYFIGLFASKRMGDRTPSGYAFNYSMMQRLGIVNLHDSSDDQTEIDLPESF